MPCIHFKLLILDKHAVWLILNGAGLFCTGGKSEWAYGNK